MDIAEQTDQLVRLDRARGAAVEAVGNMHARLVHALAVALGDASVELHRERAPFDRDALAVIDAINAYARKVIDVVSARS